MPAEWSPHEGTLMAWPCRVDLWGAQRDRACAEYAATANAIAAFEPLTMVCASAAAAERARAALTASAEVLELPIDDSWLRDNGPIFVVDGEGRRAGVHFCFNAWGGKFPPWDHDAAVGRLLVERLGDRCYDAGFVLEGGSICVDGEGTLITTEQCLLHPNRNPAMSRAEIEEGLREHLGVERVVWLGDGLAEDRDTDGHVDLVAAFTRPGEVLLQSAPDGNPNSEPMADNRSRLEAAGLAVVDFPPLEYEEVEGERVACSYMNFYLCNSGVIVPTAGKPADTEALERIGAAYPAHEVVGVPGVTIAYGGGGPHCITQQVPAVVTT
jgi:agmatine deiminase